MPQQDLLFPWRTVAENVRLPLEIRGGFSAQEMDRMTAEVLESVGLTGWGQKAPKELSGGMRQRAAFARTLLTGADLLLLDEPFSALDYLTRLSMREWLLSQWEQEQKTVLFITHDVEEAIFLSTRILAVEEMPITRLRSFDVPLTHPRSVESLNAPEALALKDELIALLRKTPGGNAKALQMRKAKALQVRRAKALQVRKSLPLEMSPGRGEALHEQNVSENRKSQVISGACGEPAGRDPGLCVSDLLADVGAEA